MAGEVTATSVILQSRLTETEGLVDGDVPGARGVASFEISANSDFAGARRTEWLKAEPERDFIVRVAVGALQPGTRYYYRLVYGADKQTANTGPTRSFQTLPGVESDKTVSFVVVTGMNYAFFMTGHANGRRLPAASATAEDKRLGYPAMEAMRRLHPDFFVGTGDNVYYDHPAKAAAQTLPAMRRKWHEQFVQPRSEAFFGEVASFWEKDDHDARYNDCDNTGDKPPSPKLGNRVFLEQMPVVDPATTSSVTYRTYRVSRHLQVWFTEGRDYRSPNNQPDGPDKSLWGREQREWLQRTLLASDATWRVLVSPTPMIGPDGARKRDNHTNPNGFRHEGDSFFEWLKRNNVRNFAIVCGDRHWKYHSIHPTGYEEFSCGAICDENAVLGPKPGDESSSDPDATIRQPWMDSEPSGGFLRVVAKPDTLAMEFHDDAGALLYHHAYTQDALPAMNGEAYTTEHATDGSARAESTPETEVQPPEDVGETSGRLYETRVSESSDPLTAPCRYKLWMPNDTRSVRCVLAINQRAAGRHLFHHDLEWRAMASRNQAAMMYCEFEAMGVRDNGYGESMLKALDQFGAELARPELEHSPLVLWGHSMGGRVAQDFVRFRPERVLAFVIALRAYESPAEFMQEEAAAMRVPALYVMGAEDKKPGDIRRHFERARATGAPRAWLWLPNQGHMPKGMSGGEDKTTVADWRAWVANDVVVPWIEAMIQLRLPAEPQPPRDPSKLLEPDLESGWLSDDKTGHIAGWKQYEGDRAKASWLPTEEVARAWARFAFPEP